MIIAVTTLANIQCQRCLSSCAAETSQIGFYTDGETEGRRAHLPRANKLVNSRSLIGTLSRVASATRLSLLAWL